MSRGRVASRRVHSIGARSTKIRGRHGAGGVNAGVTTRRGSGIPRSRVGSPVAAARATHATPRGEREARRMSRRSGLGETVIGTAAGVGTRVNTRAQLCHAFTHGAVAVIATPRRRASSGELFHGWRCAGVIPTCAAHAPVRGSSELSSVRGACAHGRAVARPSARGGAGWSIDRRLTAI
jgi:hypothetical protein